ncbi:hypothetical protein K2173_021845 [Erythroxylum novogranatense]|uniref:J domain-containing protein n=1 Tax=Erythroxylum novogranatense TaxID=1862640 RepID=A0AAV8T220_9ROSI|nr:hypothetical protein K2173_021845 [Erythroxylum novogranatense]
MICNSGIAGVGKMLFHHHLISSPNTNLFAQAASTIGRVGQEINTKAKVQKDFLSTEHPSVLQVVPIGNSKIQGSLKMGSKIKRKRRDDTPSSSSTSGNDSDTSSESRRCRDHKKDRRSCDRSSRREKKRKRRERRERRKREKERKSSKGKKKMNYDFESGFGSESGSGLEGEERLRNDPEAVVAEMLREFPNVSDDLKQLLQMIDDGQAVDIKGISEKSLIKHLKKLFVSLNLNESGDKVFLLPPRFRPTLEVVEPLIQTHVESKEQLPDHLIPSQRDDMSASRRRMIGPEMPSAELLAAAAKLTEAQVELRDAEVEEDSELFIGPAPPALIAEAEFANEAERFEEVTRIMGVEKDSPYDVIGVNQKMSAGNIKKRYWKISLLVHPDKCSHPQAHQAFIKLNKAFKELQDPEKRKVLDDKIKLQEEHEQFKVELQAMREAAEWRRKQASVTLPPS